MNPFSKKKRKEKEKQRVFCQITKKKSNYIFSKKLERERERGLEIRRDVFG